MGYTSFEDIGKTDSAEQCAYKVQVEKPTANGATHSSKNKKCWAGFGITGADGQGTIYTTCLFEKTGKFKNLFVI